MTAQIERSREKLSRSRNERESNAAQRELEELRKLQRDREDEINKLSTLSESARKSIEETEAAQKKIADELGGRESDISKTLAEAMKERDAKLVDRGKLAAAVQPMTLRRYEQVRKRKSPCHLRCNNRHGHGRFWRLDRRLGLGRIGGNAGVETSTEISNIDFRHFLLKQKCHAPCSGQKRIQLYPYFPLFFWRLSWRAK